jgi:7-carboxy-7-deazaguanine synthase
MSGQSFKNQILKINEIFYSIQGESTQAGLPCVFVRLAYCNLRCSYCDTAYAFYEGQDMTIADILQEVKSFNCPLVEVTGGEPLLQKSVLHLLELLCDQKYEVLLETAGHVDILPVDRRVRIIMDLKCPSSGETDKMHWPNLNYLKPQDEIKFVIGNRGDFDWATYIIRNKELTGKCSLLISPVFGQLDLPQLAAWIMETKLPLRLQLQIHKFIWGADKRGV